MDSELRVHQLKYVAYIECRIQNLRYSIQIECTYTILNIVDTRYNIEYSVQDLDHRRQNTRSKILNIVPRLGTKSREVKNIANIECRIQNLRHSIYIECTYTILNIVDTRYNIEYSIQDLDHRRQNTKSKILNTVHRLRTKSIEVKICSIYRMQIVESRTQYICEMCTYNTDYSRYKIQYRIQRRGFRPQKIEYKKSDIEYSTQTRN